MGNEASIQSSPGEGPGWQRDTSEPLASSDEARPASTDGTKLLAALKEMEERASRGRKVALPPLGVQPQPPL